MRRAVALLFALTLGAASTPLTVTIPAIVEVGDISSLASSPDGEVVAFRVDRPSLATNRVGLRWHIVAVTTGSVREVADGGEAQFDGAGMLIEEPPIWAPDGRGFYARAAVGGAVQLWRAQLAGRPLVQVTAEPGDILALHPGKDGRTLAYEVGPDRSAVAQAEQAIQDRGVRLDASIELAVGVVGGRRDNNRERSSRLAGPWFARQGLLDGLPRRRRHVDLVTGVVSPVHGTEQRPDARPPVQAASPPPPCSSTVCPAAVTTWQLRDHQGDWIGVRDAASAMRIYRRRGVGWRLVARSPGLLSGGRSPYRPCISVRTGLVCVAAAATSPPRLVLIDGRLGRQRVLTDPNPRLRQDAARIAHRVVRWRSQGVSYAGHLLGAAGRMRPLVLSYYQCDGFLRGGTGDELPMLPLAGSGTAALCVNAPMVGPPTSKRFGSYQRAVAAVRAITEHLVAEQVVDRSRIGMQGLSFGSEVTTWMMRHSSLLRAASLASLQAEPGYYWQNAGAGRDFPTIFGKAWQVGDPDEDADGWRSLSPARDAAALRAPLLLQLPELEARQSGELLAKLGRGAVPYETYVYPGASHIKSQPRQKAAAYQRNLDWFDFWLADRINPDPAKAEQYARWRSMRARWQREDGARP